MPRNTRDLGRQVKEDNWKVLISSPSVLFLTSGIGVCLVPILHAVGSMRARCIAVISFGPSASSLSISCSYAMGQGGDVPVDSDKTIGTFEGHEKSVTFKKMGICERIYDSVQPTDLS